MIILTNEQRDFIIGKYSHGELNPILLKTGEYCLPDSVMIDDTFTEVHGYLNELPIRKIIKSELYGETDILPKQDIEPLYNINLGAVGDINYFAEIYHTPRVSKKIGFVEFVLVGKKDNKEISREKKSLTIDGTVEIETNDGKKKDIELILLMDESGTSLKDICSQVLPLRKDYIVTKK